MTYPLAPGDDVLLQLNQRGYTAKVLAIAPWEWILVESPSKRHYLEVVVNKSAVSWSRLVLLAQTQDPADHDTLSRLAARIANKPDRTDVEDIPEAETLCPASDRINRP